MKIKIPGPSTVQLLTAAMVTTILPGMGLAAPAAGNGDTGPPAAEAPTR